MIKGSKQPRYSSEEYIKKANQVHNNKYNYSLTEYTGSRSNIKIICPVHGIFEQNAAHHLHGSGCKQCYFEKNFNTTKSFILNAKKQHDIKYDYSLTNYVNDKINIKIICPIHGVFEQKPNKHLSGKGCPECIKEHSICISKLEKKIVNYIKQIYTGEIIENDKNIISPYELDITIPEKKIAFEINGLYWHSEERGKDKNYHLNKTKKCSENGYQLIHIFEDEWKLKNKIVKNRIKNLLGKTPYKIYARKCVVKNVDNNLSNKFLEKYHLQGACTSKKKLGLFYKNRLVALMTFGKPRFNNNYICELLRYCTIGNFNIVGGASKLLSYFQKFNAGSIISYADRRWSKGNLYKKLGFKELKSSDPSYYYVHPKDNIRNSRFKFQKHRLKYKLKIFEEKLSEYQNLKNNGYYRVWDCGNKVFVKL